MIKTAIMILQVPLFVGFIALLVAAYVAARESLRSNESIGDKAFTLMMTTTVVLSVCSIMTLYVAVLLTKVFNYQGI